MAGLLPLGRRQDVSRWFLFWDIVDTDGGFASSGTSTGCKSLVPVLTLWTLMARLNSSGSL